MPEYGPFENVEEKEDEYIITGTYMYPTGFGTYAPRKYTIRVPKTAKIRKTPNGVYVETDQPWLKSIPLGTEFIVPRSEGNTIETVVPIATISRVELSGMIRHTFYGYYVRFEGDRVTAVMDGGIYERNVPLGQEKYEILAPARIVKKYNQLSDDELNELAEYTPTNMLPALHSAGRRDIVARAVASIVRRDPLSVANLPRDIVENYVLDWKEEILRTSFLENTPMVMKELIELLRVNGYDAEKLSFMYERYYEEKQEDEELERMKKEEEKQYEEWEKREERERRAREAREAIKEYSQIIREVLGIALPLTIAGIGVGAVARKVGEERAEEAEEKEEIEETLA